MSITHTFSCEKGMDEHMEDASGAAGSSEAPETLEGLRRRAVSLKRKNNSSSSASSKRLAKDRSPLPPLHNGPSVKTRQSPNKMGGAQQKANPIPAFPQKRDDHPRAAIPSAQPQAVGGDSRQQEERVDPGAAAVASMELAEEILRDENAHIVPTPAGWFSWTRIHMLEKRALPSFFNGKSKSRNPDMYLEIRNVIMKRYHRSPHKQIGVTDVSDIVSEDTDAVREILDFLDHWGLINFQLFSTFQQAGPIAKDNLNSSTVKGEDENDEVAATASELEKLYRFEKVDSSSRKKYSAATSSMSLPTPVLAEAAIPEVLIGPQGPAVEYHCNSCQADCSTKRYHCQKQADFDLCSECYNAERFGTGMASTDFILMEPMTEKGGINGGSWTDQETLLLLEALELYGDNWNEIAEHVATKSKAQCILHFIRLPIEDPFLENKDMPDTVIQSSLETTSGNKDSLSPAPQNASESPVAKSSSSEEQPGVSKNDDVKSKQVDEGQPSHKKVENDAIKALLTAFQAVGALSRSEEPVSFAEAGNPVMALVAFLAAMVGSEVAAASGQSALKAMHDEVPAMQLVAKHCFLLEDPSTDSRDENTNSRTDAQKPENESLAVEQSKNSEEDPTKKIEGSVLSEAPKETETLEASTSIQESQPGAGISNSTMTNGENTGKVDPEQACSASGGKTGKVDSEQACTASGEKTDTVDPEQACSTSGEKNGKDNLEQACSASEEKTGKVDPEQTCSASGEKTDKVDLEQTCSTNNKKCPDDLVEVEGCHSMDKTKHATEKKNPEDSVGVEDSHSSEKMKSASEEKCSQSSVEAEDSHHFENMKRAAITVLSGAAVKAKVLADQEEEHIQLLVTEIIDNQLKKLDMKLRHFRELESALSKARDQVEREKQKLLMERANIVAARFGFPGAQPRFNSLPSAIGNPPASALGRFPSGGGLRSISSVITGTTKLPVFTSPRAQITSFSPTVVPSSSASVLSSAPGSTSHTIDPQEVIPPKGANQGSGFK